MKFIMPKLSKKTFSILFLLLLIIGISATVYEVKRRQDIRQRAEQLLTCTTVQATCRWDPTANATRYFVTVTEVTSGNTIKSEWVTHPTTALTFSAQPGKTYRCNVSAENSCGQGSVSTAQVTCPTPLPAQ